MVSELIRAKADVNIQADDGSTALHAAFVNGGLTIIDQLFEAGADVCIRNESGCTPLHSYVDAVVSGETEYSDSVLNVMSIHAHSVDVMNLGSDNGETVLFYVWDNCLPLTQQLLNLGADPNAQNKKGMTPLFKAVSNAQTKTMYALLDAGADADLRDYNKCAPLDLAAYLEDLEAYKVLVEKTTNMNVKHRTNGETGLFNVLSPEQLPKLKLLLENGADPNAMNSTGRTPLSVFIESADTAADDNASVVKLLLDYGADPNIHNGNGITVLYSACNRGNNNSLKVIEALLSKGADPERPNLCDANEPRPIHVAKTGAIIELLTDYSADPNAATVKGNLTALHMLARSQEPLWKVKDVMGALLKAGADPNVKNNRGDTPLHCYARRGRTSVALHFVLNAHVNPYIVGFRRQTAIESVFKQWRENAGAVHNFKIVLDAIAQRGIAYDPISMNVLTLDEKRLMYRDIFQPVIMKRLIAVQRISRDYGIGSEIFDTPNGIKDTLKIPTQ